MASDKGEMAMDKMKLHLKSEAIFSPDEYFRKARTYLANCMDIFLWALIYFCECLLNVFVMEICQSQYFFAELLWTPSNLSGMPNFFLCNYSGP